MRVNQGVGCLLAAVFVCGGLVALWHATPSLCGNDLKRRIAAPDGRHDLVVFERDCGATTDFSTQVSIVDHGADLGDHVGNVYVYDHQVPLLVTWTSARSATLRLPPGVHSLLEAPAVSGVSFTFVADTAMQ